jgi:lipopolysaccharide transport system permease protein
MIARSTNYRNKISLNNIFELIYQKAKAGLRSEASRGYMGVLWWVIEPVMYMFVFYIAFAHLLKRGDENFVIFLLTGLIVWKWFHATVNTSANSLIANAGLIRQIYVPKIIFPLTNVAVNTFKFLIILAIFLVFLQFTAVKVSLSWAFLPLLIISQLFLIASISSFLAAIMPFFPDLKQILDNVLLMFFFLSGIFFDINKLPLKFQQFIKLNPMAIIIDMYRKILLDGLIPEWNLIFWIFLVSVIIMILAVLLFNRYDRIYPKITL